MINLSIRKPKTKHNLLFWTNAYTLHGVTISGKYIFYLLKWINNIAGGSKRYRWQLWRNIGLWSYIQFWVSKFASPDFYFSLLPTRRWAIKPVALRLLPNSINLWWLEWTVFFNTLTTFWWQFATLFKVKMQFVPKKYWAKNKKHVVKFV